MSTVTSTLRLEVLKPLDGDWARLGALLRALRAPQHRVLNNAITDLELAKASATEVHPQTLAYRRVRDRWEEERAAAAERVAKGKPYSGDEDIAVTEPSTAALLGAAGVVYARWGKWNKSRWKGDMTLPTFKGGSAIYVASSNDAIQLYPNDGSTILRVHLVNEVAGERTGLIVRPYGPSGYAALRYVLEHPESVGDVRLKEEQHDGKRKWQAFLSYSQEVTERTGDVVMALHRGVKNFLTVAISSPGREVYTAILETGEDILKHKQAYAARRRSLGQQGRQLGAGAKGHGHDRRYERITRLEAAEAHWVRSKCQEVAAHADRLAEPRNVSRLLIEDWTNPAKDGAPELGEYLEYLVRSFPLAQLRETIEWRAKRSGRTVEVAPRYAPDSRTCPLCRHVHEAAQVGTFLCANPKCRLKRPVDVVYVWNMLLRHAGEGHPHPVKSALRNESRVRGQIKAAVERAKGETRA